MIYSLKKKFILLSSGAILLILIIVLTAVNGMSYFFNIAETQSILQFIIDNNGRMPSELTYYEKLDFHSTEELPYETRYFTMILDSDKQLVMTDYNHIGSVNEEKAEDFYQNVLAKNKARGQLKISGSLYFYAIKPVKGQEIVSAFAESIAFEGSETYYLIVFIDCSNKFYILKVIAEISVIIGWVCFALSFIFISIFSKRAILPVIENYEKQKQFITNAGHELKTPLAIISANTEIIETTDGSSEWTQSILHQVNRLTGLVNDLIALARLEETAENTELVFKQVNLSVKVSEVLEAFRPVAEQQNKELKCEIQENIMLNGSEKSLHELVSILTDNAIKYCDDNGMITASLSKQRKYVIFNIANSYQEGEHVDYNRFFDRFYREDKSHNQDKKAGYGIGLSMAESIVRLHKGKISVSYQDGMIFFQVQL